MKTEKALRILLWSKGIFLHISGESKNWYIKSISVIFTKLHIIMHSNEMNKIKVQNVKKIRWLPFSMKFSFRWETTVFLFVVQIEWKLDIICKIKNKIDFIRENFSVFFVVFVFFKNLRVNYLCELGKKYSYKSKTMRKTEKLHRRK